MNPNDMIASMFDTNCKEVINNIANNDNQNKDCEKIAEKKHLIDVEIESVSDVDFVKTEIKTENAKSDLELINSNKEMIG